MIKDDPNYRTEIIQSFADVQRYDALFALGLDGAADNWLLDKYAYSTSADGYVKGTATFRKLIPIGDNQ